jgi:pSer/pThr/pTyr-binding forkhead associated (FHA) protein
VTVYDGLIIGRGRGADVQLTDTTVSRRHAIIRVSQGQCFIQDPGSSNGTYVNGRRITAQALRDGDRITIGDAELIFRSK